MESMKCVLIQVRYYLKKGTRSEFYRKFRDNNIREMSQSEEGNIEYSVFFPLDSDNDVCIIEKWESLDNIEAHKKTLHYAILNELKEKYVTKVELAKFWAEELN